MPLRHAAEDRIVGDRDITSATTGSSFSRYRPPFERILLEVRRKLAKLDLSQSVLGW